MPSCTDDRGGQRDLDECQEKLLGYSQACGARLEPFSSWRASRRRPASRSSPESMLDSERIGHSCTGGRAAGHSTRCDCVRYEEP